MVHEDMAVVSNDQQPEETRLAALRSTAILDSPPESNYDVIARLAAEYFHADGSALAFADQSRVWVKSHWGHTVREVPRKDSIFDIVLAEDGPVLVSDLAAHPDYEGRMALLKRHGVACFASVPVRSPEGLILGCLSIFCRKLRDELNADELSVLESLANLAASQLELRRLSKIQNRHNERSPLLVVPTPEVWPRQADLRRALDDHQFVLHYQPEIDLVSRRIIGLEALIRWEHPERGMVAPMDFIPLAEESDIILPLGDWVLAEACRQIQEWNQENLQNHTLRVCVNLSARQFSRTGLADHVQALLVQTGISSRQLGVEMTETSLITNMGTALEVLNSLRRLGVSLLMNDFGTGYSSLNHLHSFPFDVLKIDRTFVGRMTDGEQPLQIVRTIIELARVMGMDVVAEGIETNEQYQLLRQMGCRYGQGYLFAKPLNATAVSRLLRLPGRILPGPEEARKTLV